MTETKRQEEHSGSAACALRTVPQDAISVPKWWLKNEIAELEADASEAIDKKMYFTAGKLFGKAEAYREMLESDE